MGRYHVTWEEFDSDCDRLAAKINRRGQFYKKVVGVARGGLIPATIIAHKLGNPIVDCMTIKSYSNDNVQGAIEVVKTIEGDGTGVLVIDDLVDSGNTVKVIRELLPYATIATVYAKPKGALLVDMYSFSFDQDEWLIFPWELH